MNGGNFFVELKPEEQTFRQQSRSMSRRLSSRSCTHRHDDRLRRRKIISSVTRGTPDFSLDAQGHESFAKESQQNEEPPLEAARTLVNSSAFIAVSEHSYQAKATIMDTIDV